MTMALLASSSTAAQVDGTMIVPGCDAPGKLINLIVGDGPIEPIDADDMVFRAKNPIVCLARGKMGMDFSTGRKAPRLRHDAEPPKGGVRFRRMLDHTGIVVSDLAKARAFYDAIAAPLGLGTSDNGDSAFLLGKSKEEPIPYLWIGTLRPSYWAEGSRPGLNQAHIAFIAPSRDAVHAFHEAGIAAGGRDHGAPGPREGAMGYYGAFLLDPDGNNIEACCRDPIAPG